MRASRRTASMHVRCYVAVPGRPGRLALAGLAVLAALLLLAPSRGAAERPALVDALEVGIERDAEGVVRVFGLLPSDAREVYLKATKADALPPGYVPADLVSLSAVDIPAAGQQYLRAIVVDDTRALFAAAAAEGYDLYVGSGYRSEHHQRELFARQVARRGDEELANRWSARPGHSQHQLGTTIDFGVQFRAFGSSPAGRWVWDHAHEYGFVFPYTEAAQELTGYVPEPWHARWVGRALARWMYAAEYQAWTTQSADDVVAALRLAAALD